MDRVRQMREAWQVVHPDLDFGAVEVVARVSRLAAHFDSAADELMGSYSISRATWDVLASLRRAGDPFERSPSELQRTLVCSSGLMTNRLNRLESDGLVARRPDPDDGRGVLVGLTDHGAALVDEILPRHLANQERLIAGLGRAERALLAEQLQRLLAEFDGPTRTP